MTEELNESPKVITSLTEILGISKAYLVLMILSALFTSVQRSFQGQALVQLVVSEYFLEHASQTKPELQCGVTKGWSSTNGVAR